MKICFSSTPRSSLNNEKTGSLNDEKESSLNNEKRTHQELADADGAQEEQPDEQSDEQSFDRDGKGVKFQVFSSATFVKLSEVCS